MNVCRTCLTIAVEKDIAQLSNDLDEVKETSAEIMLFCLNIDVSPELKLTTKLCLTCYLNILEFFKFKKLALKNEKYLRSRKVNSYTNDEKTVYEIFLPEDIKDEDTNFYIDNTNNNQSDVEFKVEYEFKEEFDEPPSEDELLSVIKKIKEENKDEESKENEISAPVKEKTGKKRKRNREMEKREQICEECGKIVLNSNLKQHQDLHKPLNTRKRYKCKSCDKTFVSPRGRLKHYTIKHLGIKQHCQLCNKDVVALSNHLKIVHKTSPLPHGCVLCDKRFLSKSLKDIHMLSHTSDTPFKCDQCEKGFKSTLTLQMHKRQVHDKEKTHICQFCSKSFFKKYHLQCHIRSHSKEKPYECPECGKCFSTTTILKNHRLIHSDVKSYACEHCDMKFQRLGYLRNHMISHTKEKRYSCQYCGLRFGRSDHRRRHEKNSHEKHIQDKNE